MKLKVSAGLLFLLCSQNCLSESIYIDRYIIDHMNAELSGSASHLYYSALNPFCKTTSAFGRAVCKSASLRAESVQNIRLQGVDVDYSEVKLPPIPDKVEYESHIVKNCTTVDRIINEDIVTVIKESNSITVNESVKTSNSTSIDAKFNISDKFNFAGSSSSSFEINLTRQISDSIETTKTTTKSINEFIPQYTALIFTVEKTSGSAYIDFSGTLEFDADLYVVTKSGVKKTGTLRDYFLIPPTKVTGQIWNVSAKSTKVSYLEVPLPTTAEECYDFDLDRYFGVEVNAKTSSIIR